MKTGDFVFIVTCAFLFSGCLGNQGKLEKIYGQGLSQLAKFCIADANDSDAKFYECTVNLAIGVGNSSLCEEVFTESPAYEMRLKRDSCLFRSEEVGHEPGACLRIVNKTIRDYCIASGSQSPEGCLSLPEGGNSCILEAGVVPVITGDRETAFSCRPLEKSTCLLSVASRTGDASACKLIEKACDVELIARCRIDSDECFSIAAEKSGNSSLCQDIARPFKGTGLPGYVPEKAASDCGLRAFNSSKRLAGCSELSGKLRGECIAQYAVSSGDPLLCDRIGGEFRGVVEFPVRYDDYLKPHSDWSVFAVSKIHDECIANLAVSLKNPSLCRREFLVNDGSSLCFFEAAGYLNESSLCMNIGNEKTRESCLGQFK